MTLIYCSLPIIVLSLFKVSFLNSQSTGNWTSPPRYLNDNSIISSSIFNTVTLCITPWCEIFLPQWKPLPHTPMFMQTSYKVPQHFLSLMPIPNPAKHMLYSFINNFNELFLPCCFLSILCCHPVTAYYSRLVSPKTILHINTRRTFQNAIWTSTFISDRVIV